MSESHVTYFLYFTHLCNFYAEITTIALKKFYYTRIESVACLFLCSRDWDKNYFLYKQQILFGVDPSQINSHNWTDPGKLEHRCSDQKIHNVANSGSSFSSTKGAVGFDFGENCQTRWDILAKGWILR